MTDPVSPEGLREVEGWLKDPMWPRFGPGISPDPLDTGRMAARSAVEQVLAALRDTGSRPDSGIDVERLRRAVFNIDHATPGVGWVEDVVAEYARLSTPSTETTDD